METQFVSVQGYLHSGSGAVNDLLREYSNVTVLSHSGDCGTGQEATSSTGEIVFLRVMPWFVLRDALDDGDLWRQDNLIKCFIAAFYRHMHTASTSNFYRDDPVTLSPEFRAFIHNFICDILELPPEEKTWLQQHPEYVFPVTRPQATALPFSFIGKTYCHYTLREDLTRKALDELLRQAFNGILEIYRKHCAQGNSLIVCDQLLSGYSVESLSPYLPHLKQIIVFRDIRDHYLWLLKSVNPGVFSILNASAFIDWVRALKIGQLAPTSSRLCLRFEELLYDYDNTVYRIERFLDLDPAWHVRRGQYLIPELSRRNCRLYRRYPDQSLIRRLEEAFPELCYFSD